MSEQDSHLCSPGIIPVNNSRTKSKRWTYYDVTKKQKDNTQSHLWRHKRKTADHQTRNPKLLTSRRITHAVAKDVSHRSQLLTLLNYRLFLLAIVRQPGATGLQLQCYSSALLVEFRQALRQLGLLLRVGPNQRWKKRSHDKLNSAGIELGER